MKEQSFWRLFGNNHISKGMYTNTVQYQWVWLLNYSKSCVVCSLSLVLMPTQLWCCSIWPAVTQHCATPKPTNWLLPRAPLHSYSAIRDAVCHHSVPVSSSYICPSQAHSADLEQIIGLCKDLNSSTGPEWGGDEREERGKSTSFLSNSLHVQRGLECHAPPCFWQLNGFQLGHPHQPPWRWGMGCVMSQSLQNTALTPEFWISTDCPWFF